MNMPTGNNNNLDLIFVVLNVLLGRRTNLCLTHGIHSRRLDWKLLPPLILGVDWSEFLL